MTAAEKISPVVAPSADSVEQPVQPKVFEARAARQKTLEALRREGPDFNKFLERKFG